MRMQCRHNAPEDFHQEILKERSVTRLIAFTWLSSFQKTEDVPIKVSATCCSGGSGSLGSSSSLSSHGSSGGSLPHSQEQLPKYQVRRLLKLTDCRGDPVPQEGCPPEVVLLQAKRISTDKCALQASQAEHMPAGTDFALQHYKSPVSEYGHALVAFEHC